MRGDCLFCSYWWNRWQSLFKISFYYTYDWHYNTNIAYTWLSLQYKKKIYLTVITMQKENISDRHYNTERKYIWPSLQYKKKIYFTVIRIQIENISDCHYIQIYHISDCYHNTNIAYTFLYLTFITIQI